MKLKMQSRAAAVLAAAALAVSLVGCTNGASSASQSASPAPTQTTAPNASGTKLGLGLTTQLETADTGGKATVTEAGVLLDADGRILCCVVDVAENSYAADANGALSMPATYTTKWEQGDAYGLKGASGIGKEWYEQAGAFCNYAAGKTPEEIEKIKTDDAGKTEDPDLLAGCTIKITPFIEALSKACTQAKASGATNGDILSLGTVSTPSGTDATDDADGSAQVSTTAVLMTRDSGGKVTGAVMDQIQPSFRVDTNGQLLEKDTEVRSKLELGDDYGLKAVSGIGKEWYEQSEGFCNYLVGKTAGDIRSIPANGTDADLAAVCTIDWTDMLQAAVKASEANADTDTHAE